MSSTLQEYLNHRYRSGLIKLRFHLVPYPLDAVLSPGNTDSSTLRYVLCGDKKGHCLSHAPSAQERPGAPGSNVSFANGLFTRKYALVIT